MELLLPKLKHYLSNLIRYAHTHGTTTWSIWQVRYCMSAYSELLQATGDLKLWTAGSEWELQCKVQTPEENWNTAIFRHVVCETISIYKYRTIFYILYILYNTLNWRHDFKMYVSHSKICFLIISYSGSIFPFQIKNKWCVK